MRALKVDDILSAVKTDFTAVQESVYPALPQEVKDFLFSTEFVNQCMAQFDALDTDGNGTLSPDELAPVVANVVRSEPWDVTFEQCQKFANVFDADGNGTIERAEFLTFAQKVMVMSFLEQEEAEVAVEEAAAVPTAGQPRRKSVVEQLGMQVSWARWQL